MVNKRLKDGLLSLLKVCCPACLLYIFVACGHDSKTPGSNTDTTHQNNDHDQSDTSRGLNWLDDDLRHGWDTVAFTSNPEDSVKIELEKRDVRIYVRGWLAEYNAEILAINPDTVQYIVREFNFSRRSRIPLRYTVTAFLRPGARHHPGVGGHLIPPEPPPPKK